MQICCYGTSWWQYPGHAEEPGTLPWCTLYEKAKMVKFSIPRNSQANKQGNLGNPKLLTQRTKQLPKTCSDLGHKQIINNMELYHHLPKTKILHENGTVALCDFISQNKWEFDARHNSIPDIPDMQIEVKAQNKKWYNPIYNGIIKNKIQRNKLNWGCERLKDWKLKNNAERN